MARLSFKNKKRKANNAKKHRGRKRKFGGAAVSEESPPSSSIYTTTKTANGAIVEIEETTNHYSKLAENLKKCNDDIEGISNTLNISNDITTTLLQDVDMSQAARNILMAINLQREKLISAESSNQFFQEKLSSLQDESQSKQEKINHLDKEIMNLTEGHESDLALMDSQYKKMVGEFNQRIFELKIDTLRHLGEQIDQDSIQNGNVGNAAFIKKVEEEKKAHDELQKNFGELEQTSLQSQRALFELSQKLVNETMALKETEKIKETLTQTLTESKEKISKLQAEVSHMKSKSEENSHTINRQEGNITTLTTVNEKMKGKISDLQKFIEQLTTKKEGFEIKMAQSTQDKDQLIKELKGLIQELKQSHKEHIESLNKLYDQTIKGQNEEFQKLMQEKEGVDKQNSENMSKIQELETELELLKILNEAQLQTKDSEHLSEINLIQSQNESVRQQMLNQESIRHEKELSETQQKLANIRETVLILEDEKKQIYAKLTQTKSESEETIETLEQRINELKKRIDDLNVSNAAKNTVSEMMYMVKINNYASELEKVQKQLAEKETQLKTQQEQSNEKLTQERKKLQELQKINEELVEKLKQSNKEKADFQSTAQELLERLKYENETLQNENKTAYEKITKLENELQQKMEEIKRQKEGNKKMTEDFEKKIQELKSQNQKEIEGIKTELQGKIEKLKEENENKDNQLLQQSQEIEAAKNAFNKIEKEITSYNEQSGIQRQTPNQGKSQNGTLLTNIKSIYHEAVTTYNKVIKSKNEIIQSLNLTVSHQYEIIKEQDTALTIMTDEVVSSQDEQEKQRQEIQTYMTMIDEMKQKLSKIESENTRLTQFHEMIKMECQRIDKEYLVLKDYNGDSGSLNVQDNMTSSHLRAMYFRDLNDKIQLLMKLFKKKIDKYEGKLSIQKRAVKLEHLLSESKSNRVYQKLINIHNKLLNNDKSHEGKSQNNLLSNIEEKLSKDEGSAQGYVHTLGRVQTGTVNSIEDFLSAIHEELLDTKVDGEHSDIENADKDYYKSLLKNSIGQQGGSSSRTNGDVGPAHKIMKILTNLLLTYHEEYNKIKGHVLIKRYENAMTNPNFKLDESPEVAKTLDKFYDSIKCYKLKQQDYENLMSDLTGNEKDSNGIHVFEHDKGSSSTNYGHLMINCVKYFKKIHDAKNNQGETQNIDIELLNKLFFIYVSYRIEELNDNITGQIEQTKLKPDLVFIIFMIRTIKYLRYIFKLISGTPSSGVESLSSLSQNQELLTLLNQNRHSDVITYVKIRDSYSNKDKEHPFNPNFLFYIDEKLEGSNQPHSIYNNKALSLFFSNTKGTEPIKINESGSTIPSYDNHARFGNFTKIMHNVSNEEYADQMTEVKDKLLNGQNVCLIGYGSSGSGKTSTLIHFENNGTEEVGAVSQMLSKIEDLSQINVTISEIFQDMVPQTMTGGATAASTSHASRLSNKWDIYTQQYDEKTQYVPKTVTLEKVKNIEFKRSGNDFTSANEITWNSDVPQEYQEYKSQLFGDSSISSETSLSVVLKKLVTENRLQAPTPNNPQSSRSHVVVKIELTTSGKSPILYICDFAGVENKFDYEIDLEAISSKLKKNDMKTLIEKQIDSIDDIDNAIKSLREESGFDLIPDGMIVLMDVIKENRKSDDSLESLLQEDTINKIGKGIRKKIRELNIRYYGERNQEKNPDKQSISDCYDKLKHVDDVSIQQTGSEYLKEGFDFIEYIPNQKLYKIIDTTTTFLTSGMSAKPKFIEGGMMYIEFTYTILKQKIPVTFFIGDQSPQEENVLIYRSDNPDIINEFYKDLDDKYSRLAEINKKLINIPKNGIGSLFKITKNHNEQIIEQNKQQQLKNIEQQRIALFKQTIFMRIHYLHMILVTRAYEGMFINNSLASLRNSITEQLIKANGEDKALIPDFDESCMEQYCDPIMGKCFNPLDTSEITIYERNKRKLTHMLETDPFKVSLNDYNNMTFCVCLMVNNSYIQNGNYFNNPVNIPYINLEKGYRELERIKRFIYQRARPEKNEINKAIIGSELDPRYLSESKMSIDKFYFYARNLVFKDKNLGSVEIQDNKGDIRQRGTSTNLNTIRKKGINIEVIDSIYNYALKYYTKSKSISKLFIEQLKTKYDSIKGNINRDQTFRDLSDLQSLLLMIKTMNAISVVGTLDFTDEVSKYNLEFNKCAIMAPEERGNGDLITWSTEERNVLLKTPLLTTSSDGKIKKAQEYFKSHILENNKTIKFEKQDRVSEQDITQKQPNQWSPINKRSTQLAKNMNQLVSSLKEGNSRSQKTGGAKTKKYKLKNKGKKKFRKTKKN
jgi:hypothetical protein